MQFDHKAILKSNNIKKINGSVEKKYRIKIECCDTMISYCMLINQLQKDIKELNNKNKSIQEEYFKNNGSISQTDLDMIEQINNLIIHKKDLRNFYSKRIKELKENNDI